MTDEILKVATDLQKRISERQQVYEHIKSRTDYMKKVRISSVNPNGIHIDSYIRPQTYETIMKIIQADIEIQLDDLKDQYKRL